MQAANALVSLSVRVGSFDPSIIADAISKKTSCTGSNKYDICKLIHHNVECREMSTAMAFDTLSQCTVNPV